VKSKKIYLPKKELYIKSIDPTSGQIIFDKIKNLTVHYGTDLWVIKRKSTGEELIKCTGDHSLVAYNPKNNQFKKVKPSQLNLEKFKDFCLIRVNDQNEKELIPVSDLHVEKISDYEITYDFETEKTKFFLANGVLVNDTMAVVIPLSDESQAELKHKIITHIFDPGTAKFKFSVSWDAIYGLYLLTKDEPGQPVSNPQTYLKLSFDELLKHLLRYPNTANRLIRVNIKGKQVTLTLGRLLTTKALPDWFGEVINYPLTKKTVGKLLDRLAKEDYLKHKDVFDALDTYYRLMRAGMLYATQFPLDLDLFSGIEIKKKVAKYIEELAQKDLLTMVKGLDEVMEKVKAYIKKVNPTLYWAIESGARGSWADIQQTFIARGVVTDATGRVIPKLLKHGLAEGLTQEEFFIMGYAARKGIVDRAINTDKPGYLTRQLVFCNSRVLLDPELDDCGTKKCLEVYVEDENLAQMLLYKYTCDGKLITEPPKVGTTVKIRSVLYCQGKKVCRKCYGALYDLHKSKQIGIIAAQAIGERVQQTLMKSFHTGGLAKISKFPQIIPNDHPFLKQVGDKIQIKAGDELLLQLKDIDAKLSDTMLIYNGLLHFKVTSGNEVQYFTLEFLEDNLILELYYDQIIEVEDEQGAIHRYAVIKRRKEDIGQLWFTTEDMSTKVKLILKIFAASLPEAKGNMEAYLLKALEPLKDMGLNISHFEVTLSQMTRSKNKPELPWRLNQEDEYEIVGIKKVPFLESPLLALAFENIGQALTQGVLKEQQDTERKSFFEALLENDLETLRKLFS